MKDDQISVESDKDSQEHLSHNLKKLKNAYQNDSDRNGSDVQSTQLTKIIVVLAENKDDFGDAQDDSQRKEP